MNDDLEVLQNLHRVSSLKNLLTDNENIALIVTTVILIFKKDVKEIYLTVPQNMKPYTDMFAFSPSFKPVI